MDNKDIFLITISAKHQYDAVNIRHKVREIMAILGFPNLSQTMMATAVSEIVRNACAYAGGGSVKFLIENKDKHAAFCVEVTDKGPGINNLPVILSGAYTNRKSFGRGIYGSKQLVDEFIIHSEPQKGTKAILKMKIAKPEIVTPQLIQTITIALARMQPNDMVSELQQQNQEVLYALELVNKARNELEQRVTERTAEILETNKRLEQEIEKRKIINQELIETSSRLDLALKSAKVGTWSYDKQIDKLSLDAYSLALLGIDKFNGSYEDFIQFLHPSNTLQEKEDLLSLSQAMAEEQLELHMQCPEKETHYLMSRGQVFKDSQGNVNKIIGVFWDITQRKLLEEKFRQYQEQAAQALRASSMGGVASILAHEINQPLTVISTYVQGCIRRIPQEESATTLGKSLLPVLKKVAEQAHRAGEIVHRIKDFIKRGTLLLEPTDINELLKNIPNLIYQDPNSPKINFKFQLEEKLPFIKIDKLQIEQVLLNLIRNSMDILQEQGNKKPEIKILAKRKAHSLVISIIDNGPGFSIDPEELFKPYFTSKPSGMGMGLVICRDIIEAHGGSIRAQSMRNGACFEFELPLLLGETNG